jgi:hypothetical protein
MVDASPTDIGASSPLMDGEADIGEVIELVFASYPLGPYAARVQTVPRNRFR